jgi:hypothetical protein
MDIYSPIVEDASEYVQKKKREILFKAYKDNNTKAHMKEINSQGLKTELAFGKVLHTTTNDCTPGDCSAGSVSIDTQISTKIFGNK